MAELFPDMPTASRKVEERPASAPRGAPPTRPRTVPETDTWTIEDHVCRLCLGRIASRVGTNTRIFLCCDCGHTEEGSSRTAGRIHPTFCACSMRYGPRDAGVRCVVNDEQTPELPQRIVARQVE